MAYRVEAKDWLFHSLPSLAMAIQFTVAGDEQMFDITSSSSGGEIPTPTRPAVGGGRMLWKRRLRHCSRLRSVTPWCPAGSVHAEMDIAVRRRLLRMRCRRTPYQCPDLLLMDPLLCHVLPVARRQRKKHRDQGRHRVVDGRPRPRTEGVVLSL